MIEKLRKNKRIIRTFMVFLSAMLVLFVMIIGCLLLWEKNQAFLNETNNIREEYISSQKQMLQNEVRDAIAYIQYMQSQTTKRIRHDVKSRTDEAFEIVNHIYQTHKNTTPLDTVKQLAHDALFAASWDDGRGYYFAEDMEGTELINRNNPELEGTNIWDLQDSKGNFLMQDIIRVAKESGEGFTSYYWNKPDNPEVLVPKISYVKYFKPFDWVIGNGKYLDDEENLVKREIMERLAQLRFGDGNYIFAGTWDGVSLTGPFTGKNMLHLKDSNGVEIVKELIQAAQSGGNFVHYLMPKHKGVRPVPKISYAEGIADWKWYVGAGIYIDAIEKIITQRQVDFRSQILGYFGRTLVILALFFLIALGMTWWMSRKMKAHLDIFGNFFKDAADNAVNIDINQLDYVEFQELAGSANEMILLRQKALSELEASEKRFIQMVELAPIPILITNAAGRPEFINKQFERTFGYSLKDIPAIEDWMRLAFPDAGSRTEIQKMLAEAAEPASPEGAVYETDILHVRSADHRILAIRFYRTIVGDRGLVLGYDYTKIVRSEQEQASLQKQLHQAQKMEAIGMMAGGVAHDLNNILSGIVSYPEILLTQLPEDSQLRKPLDGIHQAGMRAADVVADLLTVARGVASEKVIRNVNSIVGEYLVSPEFCKLKSLFPKVIFETDFTDPLLNLKCSEIHVKKSLMNLVINAAEAVMEAGTVVITTSNCSLEKCIINHQPLDAGDYVMLSVKDDGQGISPTDLEHIFEPFYTKKMMGSSGTGLGLPIVWNTMLDHQGAVNVESGSWGTRFELYFPATQESLPADGDNTGGRDLFGDGESILVVDDEPQQRDIASHILKSLNYLVQTAASGEEGIAILKDQSVDLLVLDMIMKPGINGRETYRQVAAIHPNLRAVIVSGFSEDDDVKNTLQLGATQFLHKPYTLKQLGETVKKALSGDPAS